MTVASSETVTFSEFTNALSNPSILGIVAFEPLGGNIIIDLATNIAFAMIDRMLGGEGNPLDKTREFSDIELSILQKIMVMLTQLLRDPWKNVLEVSPVLTRLETNPQFAQIIAPGEMIAVVTLNIKIGDVEGFMNMCLPFITLEDVMDRLNTKFWYSTMQENKDEFAKDNIEAMLKRVIIPVKAVLGTSKITVNDFMKGDDLQAWFNLISRLAAAIGGFYSGCRNSYRVNEIDVRAIRLKTTLLKEYKNFISDKPNYFKVTDEEYDAAEEYEKSQLENKSFDSLGQQVNPVLIEPIKQ